MLTPKNVKYHTPHRIRFKGWASSGRYVAYGNYGIQSLQQFITKYKIVVVFIFLVF